MDTPSRVVILRRGRVFHFGLLGAQTTNYDAAMLDLMVPKLNNDKAMLLTLVERALCGDRRET